MCYRDVTTPFAAARLPLALLLTIVSAVAAQPQDFTQYTLEGFPGTNGFNNPRWLTTTTTAQLDDDNVFFPAANAYANVLYSPENARGKRISGTLQPGNGTSVDDDIVGFVLGFEPGDAFGPPGNFAAEYLLIDWKGVDQNFDFADFVGAPIVFHSSTDGGLNPAGLAISRINGLPTADELWQHEDLEDGIDGGVTELQRAFSLGRTPYDRSAETGPTRQYEFDIIYTESRVSVFVDNVLELDVTGSFPDGRFGLYTGWQGPTPVFSDFTFEDATAFDLPQFPTATIDRGTGELTIRNPDPDGLGFTSVTIDSSAGGLTPDQWLSITENYDTGGPGSVDSDAWEITAETLTKLAEIEADGADGALLASGQSLSLGQLWEPSRFEDVVVTLELTDGFSIPVVASFTGNGGVPFERADLNTDGIVNLDDWNVFFPNTLKEFDGMTATQAALLGDLDGDFDNDLTDFELFKADYESINGLGSFARAVAGVPEPAGCLLAAIGLGVLAVRRRQLALLVALVAATLAGRNGSAQALDFTTFTIEEFPNINFPDVAWTVTPSSITPTDGANTSPSVVYSPTNLRGNRIRGFLEPGTDDDVVGLVFGFQPGDATYDESIQTDADYLVLDWKGIDQSFNFTDRDGDLPDLDGDGSPDLFHRLTGGGLMPAGLAVSRVTGLANMDELWQHEDLEGNPFGGVEELQRANTLGFTPYDRSADPLPSYEFDVIWTENLFAVLVDGALEVVQSGEFSDGRFGVYTCCQSGGPVFRDFEVLPADSLDLATVVPTAVVDRATGDVTVTNGTSESIPFDAYTLTSPSGSVLASWEGLADGESGAEAAPGVAWVEAGGSDSNTLAELFLQGAGGSTAPATLAPGESFTLSGAYNSAFGEEDLAFVFRTSDGEAASALLTFEGTAAGANGDYNDDGVVDAADYTLWRDGGPLANELATPGVTDAADYTVWASSYGASSAAASGASVPEPTAVLLLSLAAAATAVRR